MVVVLLEHEYVNYISAIELKELGAEQSTSTIQTNSMTLGKIMNVLFVKEKAFLRLANVQRLLMES